MVTQDCSTLILGAGLCGLSAAYHLERSGNADYLVLERGGKAGGLATTETYDGFSFDHAIHILYSSDAYASGLICDRLLQGNFCKQPRRSYCYTAGAYTEYPYQLNNYGLPPAIIVENILGLIEARQKASGNDVPGNFEEWIYQTYGRGIAGNFMIPYNRRQWAWDLEDMNFEWIADRVAPPELADVLLGALEPARKKYGPNREFWYPVHGGIEALARAFLRYIPAGRLRLNEEVCAVDGTRREAVLAGGRRVRYERLISTAPLPSLVTLLGDTVPEYIRRHGAALHSNTVHTVNIGLEGTDLGLPEPMHWIYLPEDSTLCHRISFPGHFSSSMVPAGCTSVQAEISESAYRPCSRATLVRRTLADLVTIGILAQRDARPVSEGGRVRVASVLTLDPAYVIYDLKHRETRQAIEGHLKTLDISTKGRFGEWEYLNMDQAILSGKAAADEIARGSQAL